MDRRVADGRYQCILLICSVARQTCCYEKTLAHIANETFARSWDFQTFEEKRFLVVTYADHGLLSILIIVCYHMTHITSGQTLMEQYVTVYLQLHIRGEGVLHGNILQIFIGPR